MEVLSFRFVHLTARPISPRFHRRNSDHADGSRRRIYPRTSYALHPGYERERCRRNLAVPEILRFVLAAIVLAVALRMLVGLAVQPDEIYTVAPL